MHLIRFSLKTLITFTLFFVRFPLRFHFGYIWPPERFVDNLMVAWHIGTFARIRPPRPGCDTSKFSVHRPDLANGKQSAIVTFPSSEDDDGQLSMKLRDSLQFPFDNVYGPETSQQEIFDTICNDLVVSVLGGYNATILAYGQTGSGKTYTMTGGDHYRERGILARAISRVFQEIDRQPRIEYTCYISYMEIYNESVYDLLDRCISLFFQRSLRLNLYCTAPTPICRSRNGTRSY